MARSYDLPLPLNVISSMGTAELVETDLTDIISPDLLHSRVQVSSLADYNAEEEDGYFQRACFRDGALVPAFEEWEKYCVCRQPYNPNQDYVFCEECQGWFHLSCMGVGMEVCAVEKYRCLSCSDIKQIG